MLRLSRSAIPLTLAAALLAGCGGGGAGGAPAKSESAQVEKVFAETPAYKQTLKAFGKSDAALTCAPASGGSFTCITRGGGEVESESVYWTGVRIDGDRVFASDPESCSFYSDEDIVATCP